MPVKHVYACIGVAAGMLPLHNWGMKNLRAIREAKGLSQVQLAEMAGLNQATISKVERGGKNITIDKILAIAAALRIQPTELFELPDLQRRVLSAIGSIQDPARQEAALVVLEAMAAKAK